ncbi:hypothetical protein [Streptomyces sp. RFCAC02]|nr:hypothetical protein [Streptomyces sp. RFCAC02]
MTTSTSLADDESTAPSEFVLSHTKALGEIVRLQLIRDVVEEHNR